VLEAARAALMAPETLPSARVIAEMKMRFEGSHLAFVGAHSESTRAHMLALPFSADDEREFAELARASVAEQARIEAADTMPFEVYRQHYLAPERLRLQRNGETKDPLVTAPAHSGR